MKISEIVAYHGTTHDFEKFDPDKTGDIGVHFGTADQADRAVRNLWARRGEFPYNPGAHIRPVNLDLKNPLRVYDNFSTLRQTFTGRAKRWSLETPGFRMSPAEREQLYGWAKIADKARRKAGGDWSIKLRPQNAALNDQYEEAGKRFWAIIQASAIRQGYDGFVYANRAEGKGDSYVVFDPRLVRQIGEAVNPPGFNPRPWLTGKCFDFALALHERMPDAEFVVIGSARMPEHVALRRGDVYYDARGAIPDVRSFMAHHINNWAGEPAELIQPISREDVELHAGVAGFSPPYKGNRDIAAARRAVDAVFGKSRRTAEVAAVEH